MILKREAPNPVVRHERSVMQRRRAALAKYRGEHGHDNFDRHRTGGAAARRRRTLLQTKGLAAKWCSMTAAVLCCRRRTSAGSNTRIAARHLTSSVPRPDGSCSEPDRRRAAIVTTLSR